MNNFFINFVYNCTSNIKDENNFIEDENDFIKETKKIQDLTIDQRKKVVSGNFSQKNYFKQEEKSFSFKMKFMFTLYCKFFYTFPIRNLASTIVNGTVSSTLSIFLILLLLKKKKIIKMNKTIYILIYLFSFLLFFLYLGFFT